jgi:hypothetical protein
MTTRDTRQSEFGNEQEELRVGTGRSPGKLHRSEALEASGVAALLVAVVVWLRPVCAYVLAVWCAFAMPPPQ